MALPGAVKAENELLPVAAAVFVKAEPKSANSSPRPLKKEKNTIKSALDSHYVP